MKKYQISINISKSEDKNSASTKAVKDCAILFSSRSYKDYNLFYKEQTSSFVRYLLIFKELIGFFIALKRNAVVAVQYPMLNNVFKYFIKAARLKKVKFLCVIHDIESLRLGGGNESLVSREVHNLNYYDCIIVHNTSMMQWLKEKGITSKMIPLGVFDYLLEETSKKNIDGLFSHSIVFAGNLAKSNFIYSLGEIKNWTFNVYGPNFNKSKNKAENISWCGEFSPDEVVYRLAGNFGLIWDGDSINKCDEVLGNYLRYNNPHKFSLYLAAGLPVIAPKNSAIGKLILQYDIGVLIDSLEDLPDLQLSEEDYERFFENCKKIQRDIIQGKFFLKALEAAEMELAN